MLSKKPGMWPVEPEGGSHVHRDGAGEQAQEAMLACLFLPFPSPSLPFLSLLFPPSSFFFLENSHEFWTFLNWKYL